MQGGLNHKWLYCLNTVYRPEFMPLREDFTAGEDAHIGLGVVVVSDVAPRTVALGVPVRTVRNGGSGE